MTNLQLKRKKKKLKLSQIGRSIMTRIYKCLLDADFFFTLKIKKKTLYNCRIIISQLKLIR